MAVAVVIVLASSAAWLAKRRLGAGAGKPDATVRTATITAGDLDQTVRLSGVIMAERFAAIMVPRLRGSRATSGSYGSTGTKSLVAGASSSTAASSSTSSAGAGSSSTSSSSQSSATPATTNTAVSGQSATSGAPGAPQSSLGAIRGTQNRFGDRTAAQANTNQASTTSSGSSTTTSSTLGSTGMGSTAANLISPAGGGGAGGGGGSSDFSLVLLEVAKPGSHVKKGEVVAEFDRQYQLHRLDDYKATVIQLDADVKKTKADLAVAKESHEQLVRSAKADWDKALLDLKTAEVRSAIEAEDLKLAAQETEARYKQLVKEAKLVDASEQAQILSAELERDQAKLELDRATMNVNRMVVQAPMSGIVVMQSIWRGGDFGQVQQGDQVWPGMTFMQIVDPSSMVLMANLNQVDAESVRLGMKATARLDAYPGVQFPAHVTGIGAMTKPGAWRPNYMREIPVRLKLDQIDDRVIPDLSASADLLTASEKKASLVPLSAIFYDHASAGPFVLLQAPSGWQRRAVELGLRNHVSAVVRSGVIPGDVIAAEQPATGKPPS